MFNSTVLFYLFTFIIIISVVAAKSQNNDNTPQAKIAPRRIQQLFANPRRLKYFPHNNNANNNRNNDNDNNNNNNNNNNNYNSNIAPLPLQQIYFPANSNETGTVSQPSVLGNSGAASQNHIKRKQLSSNTGTSVETTDTEDDKAYKLLLNKQAKNAQYSFDSNVEDTINDLTNTRQEERNGLALTGMYSYSDGFFKRTVHYKADEQGYRVIKEELVPIGDGPKYNPNGQADVSSSLTGHYSVTADDYNRDYYNKFKQ